MRSPKQAWGPSGLVFSTRRALAKPKSRATLSKNFSESFYAKVKSMIKALRTLLLIQVLSYIAVLVGNFYLGSVEQNDFGNSMLFGMPFLVLIYNNRNSEPAIVDYIF
jgi:hypothetical protein